MFEFFCELQIDAEEENRLVWVIYLKKAINGDEKCFNVALSYTQNQFEVIKFRPTLVKF